MDSKDLQRKRFVVLNYTMLMFKLDSHVLKPSKKAETRTPKRPRNFQVDNIARNRDSFSSVPVVLFSYHLWRQRVECIHLERAPSHLQHMLLVFVLDL